ncbi:MAG: hypothetical protein H2040_10580 [Euryhalocaulis sp.]|uniref:hypothetical protein n=1 Tax=Euryhalocaulis sp. TaxID=2744307 RepID=UPI0018330D6F|nr:hypothetical protein [Euryhalocaulis sp.]MBA4802297.1 hypothetical protein [Euryhalocaulis sp.]
MSGTAPSQSRLKRFRRTGTLALLLYVAVLVPSILLFSSVSQQGIRLALAALPVLPMAWWGYEFVRMTRGGDEMQREIQFRAIMISAGGVVFAASLWGIFSFIMGWPEPPLFLLLPAAALTHTAAMAVLNRRYGG